MSGSKALDLLVLTADADALAAVQALLNRPKSLGIRAITYKILRHPQRDPGVYLNAHEFLRNFQSQYGHALAICDHDGSGAESKSREEVEQTIRTNLQSCGWDDRADAVVIGPELEQWIWGSSNQIPRILGWESSLKDLRTFVESQGLWRAGERKPHAPKPAMQAALKKSGVPFSPSIFQEFGAKVSWKGCQDPAFLSFLGALRRWFST